MRKDIRTIMDPPMSSDSSNTIVSTQVLTESQSEGEKTNGCKQGCICHFMSNQRDVVYPDHKIKTQSYLFPASE